MLTVPEAAARIGRSPETIRRWIRAGKLRAKKVGTQHVIDELDLVAHLRERHEVREDGMVVESPLPYGDELEDDEAWLDDLLARISINPRIVFGKPAIRGTRMSVELILELLAGGWSIEDLLEGYPHITEEDIRACIAYAYRRVESERIFPLDAG